MSVKLQSSDGVMFEVNRDVLQCFGMFREFYNSEDHNPVPFRDVDGIILEKILSWIEYHKTDGEPDVDMEPFANENSDDEDDLVRFDRDFMNSNEEHLLRLIAAANYLGIDRLYNMLCKHMADKIMDRKPGATVRRQQRDSYTLSRENRRRDDAILIQHMQHQWRALQARRVPPGAGQAVARDYQAKDEMEVVENAIDEVIWQEHDARIPEHREREHHPQI